jgi:hypothetical protein
MEQGGTNKRIILRLIFITSLASLSYEIALLRVFSITLWYHFAFMVISIAMLGIGASGTALSLFPGLKDLRRVPLYALLLAIAIPASYLLANAVPFDPARLSWDRTQLISVSLYYLILCVPFFCFGLIVSTGYSAMSHEANAVYAADLVGAGCGALAMVWFLSLGGPETSVFIISTLLATGLLYRPIDWQVRLTSVVLIGANLLVLVLSPAFIQPRMSPYKPFSLAMQFPGAERLGTTYSPYARVDLFKSPANRFSPGLSFTYLEPLPEQTGIAVDGGDLYAMTDTSSSDKLAFIRSLPSSLPYLLGRNEDVLIIEPKAGLALLTAREYGARSVSAIDSNPLVLRVMREYSRTHKMPACEHQTLPGLARTWLFASDRKFDLIDLSLMGSWPSSAFGFAEDYRFTVEAFEQYLGHLRPDGFLSLNVYIIPPPRTELRLLATLIRSAEALSVSDMDRHVAAIRSWGTLTLLMKKSALTTDDIGRIKAFAREKRFDLVYYPGMKQEEGNVFIKQPGNEYAAAFQRLMNKDIGNRFRTDYLFDIQPVSDDKPFFHYYLKARNIREIYRVMGEKWQFFIEEGYLLPVIFIQVLVVSALLICLPLTRLKSGDAGTNPGRALSYFALLGLAYLFIEIAFIQKMILGLENPSYASSTVIASVLISSGIGSLLSRRFSVLKSPRVLLVLAGVALCYGVLLSAIIAGISHYPLIAKISLSFLLLMPAGLLMGLPFPLGIAILGSTAPRLIPWAWAMNGCFSVIAPILAIMLALSAGFRFVLIAGAVMYLAAFLVIRSGWDTA